jgi:hypothetical protein
MSEQATKVVVGDQETEAVFQDALYRGACGDCGEGLEWEANFDADGTTYFARCCGHHYWMSPSKVFVSRDSE